MLPPILNPEKTVKVGRCLRNSSENFHPGLLTSAAISACQDCVLPPPPFQCPCQHLVPGIKTHFKLFNNSSFGSLPWLVNGRKVFCLTGKPGQEGRSPPNCRVRIPSNQSRTCQIHKLKGANFVRLTQLMLRAPLCLGSCEYTYGQACSSWV